MISKENTGKRADVFCAIQNAVHNSSLDCKLPITHPAVGAALFNALCSWLSLESDDVLRRAIAVDTAEMLPPRVEKFNANVLSTIRAAIKDTASPEDE